MIIWALHNLTARHSPPSATVSHRRLQTLAGPNLSPGLDRNTYLRIDGTNGDVIQSVGFANISGSTVDLLIFDHVAFAPVPEPSALVMCLIVAGPIFGRSRHRLLTES